MRDQSYTGIGVDFVIQDLCATEGQGPIQDRSVEHLTAMDMAIVAARKVMVKAINDLMEGREPSNVVRVPKANRFRIVAFNGVLPNSKHWKDHSKDLEAEIRVK